MTLMTMRSWGENCPYTRNSRGDSLLQWCGLHGLVIGNTFFETDPDKTWTYRKGDVRRQIDYILIDKHLFNKVYNCTVVVDLDIGSDHRPVGTYFIGSPRRRRKQRQRGASGKWSPDLNAYQSKLDELLQEGGSLGSADEKLTLIEMSMLNASSNAHNVSATPEVPEADTINIRIQDLIHKRRRSHNAVERNVICKGIQKLGRHRTRMKKLRRIRNILTSLGDWSQFRT